MTDDGLKLGTDLSATLDSVRRLIQEGTVRISEHGYDELAAEDIFARDVIDGVGKAVVVEDYPEYPKGPCVLVLQKDRQNKPIHVLWGIPKGHTGPAVLVTAYRPNPKMWEGDFLRRRK